MRQAGEPSMEEILESIKKVIARDSRAAAFSPRRDADERQGLAAADNGAENGAEANTDDVLDLGAIGRLVEQADEAGHKADGPALIGPSTANSISEALAALAVMAEPRAAPQIVRSGETSLEGLVRELLRPALAQWLDKNLPAMVERLVASEIARIAGKRG